MIKVKYKSIKTDIPSDTYISKIGNIVDDVKNTTFEVFFDDIKIFELEKCMFSIMSMRDGTGNISALLVGNNNKETKNIITNINLKDKYRISGNISTDVDIIYVGLCELIRDNKKIRQEMLKNKVLMVKAIQKIEHKRKWV